MTEAVYAKKPFRFTGFHMALCFAAFFGVIIAVNLFMATLASRSWTGLVVKNSYVASQKFNGELAAARVQHSHGWISQLEYQSGSLQISLSDSNGAALKLDNPVVFIGRPAFEQEDRNYKFDVTKPFTPTVPVKLATGLWDLRIMGSVDGKPYRRDARILVDSSYSGKVQ